MAKKPDTSPRAMMEQAIEQMRLSVDDVRKDGKTNPLVGAVLVRKDGTIDMAHRGELRQGDHAEFGLLERKNSAMALDGAVLYATLEPCAPGSRKHPKLGCAERVVLARIKEVYVGVNDPDPTVDGKGIRHMEDHGIKVHMFDKDLQDIIKEANKEFIAGALERAAAVKDEKPPKKVQLSPLENAAPYADLSQFSVPALTAYRSATRMKEKIGTPPFNQRLAQQGLLVEKASGALVPSGFGMLLMGKEPRTAMPQAGLLATIRYPDGREETEDFDGPLVLIPREVEAWLKGKLPNVNDRSRMERGRVDALPFEMVREAVVNALVHRDYEEHRAKCQLIVDADTIQIMSPGRPVPQITLEQLKAFNAPQVSRNPVLHFAFAQMGFAEERGLGLGSLRNKARESGLPLPKCAWRDPYIELTLYRHAASAVKASDKAMLKLLSPSERKGLAYMTQEGEVSVAGYAEHMELDPRQARRHLQHLEKLGLVSATGQTRTRRYKLVP